MGFKSFAGYETLVSSRETGAAVNIPLFLIRQQRDKWMPVFATFSCPRRPCDSANVPMPTLGRLGALLLRGRQTNRETGAAVVIFSREHPSVRFDDAPGNR
jgi:hypothetical protein